jgi:hypothetical protein
MERDYGERKATCRGTAQYQARSPSGAAEEDNQSSAEGDADGARKAGSENREAEALFALRRDA